MEVHDKKILVCIPAFNESEAIADVIKSASRHATEVLVCDDGSEDDTDRVAEIAGAIVIKHVKNMGYGAAIRTLFEVARERGADVMVTIDSDGQHDPEQISQVISPILNNGVDIVIGSRFLTDNDREQVPLYRRAGIKAITTLARMVSYNNLTDAQSGFRAYSKKALEKIRVFDSGMPISTEILLKAKNENLIVTEVPVTVSYKTEDTSTHNSVSHGMSIVYSIMQFVVIRHPMLFIGLPGIALIIISAMITHEALELFGQTRYVSTPLILISLGVGLTGIIMLVTSTLIYSIKTLLRGKI